LISIKEQTFDSSIVLDRSGKVPDAFDDIEPQYGRELE
jgi:hypothetical protein